MNMQIKVKPSIQSSAAAEYYNFFFFWGIQKLSTSSSADHLERTVIDLWHS